jgi:DUF4097 and DUF4098 domain-containing protein YvlB
MRTSSPFIIAVALLSAVAAYGASNFGGTETVKVDLPIAADGSVWIENPVGNIEVIGTDDDFVTFIAQKIVRGVDDAAVAEARQQTQILTSGDERVRVFKTQLPPLRSARWASSVNYVVRVPKAILVKIASQTADRIHITNLTRSVTVKNVNGAVVLENVTGSAVVDSVNGNILFDPNGHPTAAAQLTTVNGRIDVFVPEDSSFRWLGQTIAGDFKTTFAQVSGRVNGTTFRGGINGSHGPLITTASMMGPVFLMRKGTNPKDAKSVRTYNTVVSTNAGPVTLTRVIQTPFIEGDYTYSTPLGSVSIGQITGSAHIETGAGELNLGIVKGDCTLVSLGGPLTLGDIFGPLNVRTKAGDVMINAARGGGFASTGGGLVRILYAGAPLTLHSDGGDIIVRSTSAGVTADTPSGDITVNIDNSVRSVPIDLKTSEGNIVLNVSGRFAADIDAVVVTSDAASNAIQTDFGGLSFRRDQVGGRTRIHAVGKVNGGGEHVSLYAEEGDIRVSAGAMNPIISPAVP